MDILTLLEKMCTVEEQSVREKAVESIKKLVHEVKAKNIENDLMAMIKRLMEGDWFTSRISAVKLIPSFFPHFSSTNQKELFIMYNNVTTDDIP